MLHAKRHKSCPSEESVSAGAAAEELGASQPSPSDGSCADQEILPDSPSASYVVIDSGDGDKQDEGDLEVGDDLLSGPSLVIGQNDMMLLEMFVSRVVQEIETRYVSRILEMDGKVDALTQMCSGMADRLEAALGPSQPATGQARKPSLPALETKVESLVHLCSGLAQKVDVLLQSANATGAATGVKKRSASGDSVPLVSDAGPTDSPVVALNRESDFPDGSWLGDPSNPRMRVRCKIHPLEMTRLSRHCVSAEKLAVTLLDHLFPREVLAESNISGRGRHSKKQLEPLMIYGIYCHLVVHHNITETEWQRIKKNLDAKCRSMWKRKQRGKPLGMGKYINKQPLKAQQGRADEPASSASSSSGAAAPLPAAAVKRSGSPDLVFSDDMVVMEPVPVGDVVEVEHADYLGGIGLADFSSVKVIQTSNLAEVRLLGGDSSDLLSSNNVSLHEASARGDTDRLQASSRQFRAVIREEPIDGKQQRLMFSSVND